LEAKVTKTMASIFKHAKPASSDKRRSLAMTSASSTYTTPEVCKDQVSDLATVSSKCGITMTADGDTEGDSDAFVMKLCDKSSMACRDAYMAVLTKYTSYNNGGICDECRYHMDCATEAYCFNGECWQPGCTSNSECESANDGDDAICDTTLSKCYQEYEDELVDNSNEAEPMSNDDLTSACMGLVPGYEYKSSATSAAPLTLLAAVLLNGAAALLL
jgi:hypothetical protein